jgi:hypothetical protein
VAKSTVEVKGFWDIDACCLMCWQTNRTRARERVAAARDDWVKSKAQLDAIDEKLKPINELKKKRRTEQDGLRNAYADLEVRHSTHVQC